MSNMLLSNEKYFLINTCIERYKKSNYTEIPKLEEQLNTVSKDLIDCAHKNMFEGKWQKIYETIPDEWFKKKDYFYVSVEENSMMRQIEHEERVFNVPYPYHGYSAKPTRIIKSDHELIKLSDKYNDLIGEIDSKKRSLTSDITKLSREIEESLKPYRTKKQLKEGWPELFVLLPETDYVIKPPALVDLNKRIGL